MRRGAWALSRSTWASSLLVVFTVLCAAPSAAQRVDRAQARRALEDRNAERALASAERALTAGRLPRALTLLEASARRLPRDPRAAIRFCALTIPEDDATVDALVEGSEPLSLSAARCDALLSLAVHEGSGSLDPRLAAPSAWARALTGDRGPALARLSSRPLDERDVPALARLAALALADDDLEQADTALSLARRVRPSDLDLASDLGALRLARGDAASAVTLFRTVVAGHPGDRDAMHDLAGAYLQAGEHALAVGLLARLARDEPDIASRWLELSRARVELGSFAEAAADARRALQLAAADDATAALALGDALRLGGDSAGARTAYEEALRRDPASSRARRALDAL